MDWEKLLNEYLATHLTPQEVEDQKAQLQMLEDGTCMPMPKFQPGDIAYIVIDDFSFMHPHISECIVTGFDWTRSEGFCLNVQGTKRDQVSMFAKNIPFNQAPDTLFATCEEAGARVDQLMKERNCRN